MSNDKDSPVASSASSIFPDPAAAAQIVLAVLALAAALTYLGPVLQPFLVAIFLFYATRFGVKTLNRVGMSAWSAAASLIGISLIGSILLAQFVYRESVRFRKDWFKYENRIVAFLAEFSPAPTPAPAEIPATGERTDSAGLPRKHREKAAKSRRSQTEPLRSDTADSETSEVNADAVPEETADLSLTLDPELKRVGELADELEDPGDFSEESPRRSNRTSDAASRTSLTEIFRVSSNDVINYVFSRSLDILELITLVFFYLVFLFLGSRKLEGRVLRAFPGERGERLLAIGHGISESMERFMVVKTVVGLGMGVSAAAIMYLFGLDHWLLWAFVFFASNYITYIGSIGACIPPMVLAFLDFSSPATAVALGLLIVLNRMFWIDFVEIRMSGRQLNLDPTLLFLWLSYWGWAWGILGLILAYPMMAAVKISLWHLGGMRGWALLLSDE